MPKTLTLAERRAALDISIEAIAKEETALKEAVEAIKRKALEAKQQVYIDKRNKEIKEQEQRRFDKRYKLGEKEYEKRLVRLAFDYCPPVKTCQDCGSPTVDGYCCRYCGSSNP